MPKSSDAEWMGRITVRRLRDIATNMERGGVTLGQLQENVSDIRYAADWIEKEALPEQVAGTRPQTNWGNCDIAAFR